MSLYDVYSRDKSQNFVSRFQVKFSVSNVIVGRLFISKYQLQTMVRNLISDLIELGNVKFFQLFVIKLQWIGPKN